VIDVRITSANRLYKLARNTISAALAPRISHVALQGVDRIRIHNGIEFLEFTPSELSQ
jgi:hypothetical protein